MFRQISLSEYFTNTGYAFCEEKEGRTDILLVLSLTYYIIYDFFLNESTAFMEWHGIYGIFYRAYLVCRVIFMAFAAFRIIAGSDKKKRVLFIILLLLGIIQHNSILILMVAMAGRSMKKWLPVALSAGLTAFTAVMLLAVTGKLGMNGIDGGDFAFGMLGRTNFAFAVLFFIIAVAVIKNGIFRYYEYAIIFAVIITTYHLVHAQNSTVCMLVFLSLCIAGQVFEKIPHGRYADKLIYNVQKYLLDYSFIICYIIYWVAVHNRDKIRELINAYPQIRLSTFVYRLDMGAEMAALPLTLFGNEINEYGLGGLGSAEYHIVDSFFARVLAESGIVYFVIIMAILTYFLIKARKNHAGVIYYAFMVMAIYAITDKNFMGIDINFLIVLPFAVWDVDQVSTKEVSPG